MAIRETTYARLERAVRPWVRKEKLKRAIAICEAQLASLPKSEYHEVLRRSWLDQTHETSRWLAAFCRTAGKAMSLRALYCEMNRFEINPYEWYIDAFAYDIFGDPEDLGWLVGWKKSTGNRNRLVLRGMTDLQALFARDYRDVPPRKVRAASEVVILLLTLRMQELVDAAALHVRQSGQLPEDVPVLAAAHDSDLAYFSYGRVKPPVTRPEPARPAASPSRQSARPGVYKINGGYDKFHNSLPWDVLDYARESDAEKYRNLLDKAKSLAKSWKVPRVKLRRRKWPCDLIALYPHWVVNEKSRAALMPLLGKTVEFLPLRCNDLPDLWVMHRLQHICLAANAVHNGSPDHNMTVIRRHAFEIDDVKGKHLFGIKQAPDWGYCIGTNYVSEQFKQVIEAHELQGVVFEKVFSYRSRK